MRQMEVLQKQIRGNMGKQEVVHEQVVGYMRKMEVLHKKVRGNMGGGCTEASWRFEDDEGCTQAS